MRLTCCNAERDRREAVLLEQNMLLKQLLDNSEAKAGRRAKGSTKTVKTNGGLGEEWDKPRAERPGWRERLAATIDAVRLALFSAWPHRVGGACVQRGGVYR